MITNYLKLSRAEEMLRAVGRAADCDCDSSEGEGEFWIIGTCSVGL